jgi:hypothetical protein
MLEADQSYLSDNPSAMKYEVSLMATRTTMMCLAKAAIKEEWKAKGRQVTADDAMAPHYAAIAYLSEHWAELSQKVQAARDKPG